VLHIGHAVGVDVLQQVHTRAGIHVLVDVEVAPCEDAAHGDVGIGITLDGVQRRAIAPAHDELRAVRLGVGVGVGDDGDLIGQPTASTCVADQYLTRLVVGGTRHQGNGQQYTGPKGTQQGV